MALTVLNRKVQTNGSASPSDSPERSPEDVAELLLQLLSERHLEEGQESLLDYRACGLRCSVTVDNASATATELLSPREQEIARMVALGYPNKMIAAVLELSIWTVGTYVRRIFAKLNVTSRAAMVDRLYHAGILVKELPKPKRP